MKKYIIALFSIVALLAVFVPLASTNPDGLEKVVQTFEVSEQEPIWSGLMTDYSVSFIGNSYVSTFITGIFGVVVVFLSAFVLSKTLSHKNN